jgi:valyl-tRNA synthetase
MDKAYHPQQIEGAIYAYWLEQGVFHAEVNPAKRPYCIVIPPPNVTGVLHMGHALDETVQDLLVRWHRMRGFETLWLPGTDHAGIATQNKVEERLAEQGLTRHDLGREEFVRRTWEFKQEHHGIITGQLQRLGCSLDWGRERFTMDEGLSRAVREAFVTLYEQGLIYRGTRMINWCPRCHTGLSDLEVEHETTFGHLWYIRYPAPDGGPGLVVATTRPETMLGDTAVAVHPNDQRYENLIGKTVLLPLQDREIPVIADDWVDPEFGTGAVKVTPAHDPNDAAIGERHRLPAVVVIARDGTMTEEAGAAYAGLDRYEARRRVVADLQERGLLEKIDPHEHAVGQCQRCDTVVEPLVSTQWFVRMKPLAEQGLAVVDRPLSPPLPQGERGPGDAPLRAPSPQRLSVLGEGAGREVPCRSLASCVSRLASNSGAGGEAPARVRFVPDRWTKVYRDWLENIQDWCISRQLWWGHPIPVWYCQDCGAENCGREDPTACASCGGTNLEPDPDVLDTWFSSALWPFSTLGWPDRTPELRYFYPTSCLVTGYDIIYFWVARMIMMGMHLMGREPFREVFIHGLVRDENGRKMSKSLGNAVDPILLIDEYGADALRFALLQLITHGQDLTYSRDRLIGARNFCNKLWNASRFVIMNLEATGASSPVGVDFGAHTRATISARDQPLADRWILSRHQRLLRTVNEELGRYNLAQAADALYNHVWGEFCDWYVEIAKVDLYGEDPERKQAAQALLRRLLGEILAALHPLMPFITEAIWQKLEPGKGSLAVQPYPEADPSLIDPVAEEQMAQVQAVVSAARGLRADFGITPQQKVELSLLAATDEQRALLDAQAPIVRLLAGVSLLHMLDIDEAAPPGTLGRVAAGTRVLLHVGGMIHVRAELHRLDKRLAEMEAKIAGSEKKLANQQFVERAKAEVVSAERERLEEARATLAKLHEQRAALESVG